jgi:hypothetical protein
MDDKCTMATLLQEEGRWHGIPQTFCLPEHLPAFVVRPRCPSCICIETTIVLLRL